MSESFVIGMRCAIDGQAFRVAFDRSDPSKKWRIVRISEAAAVRDDVAGGALETAAPTINAGEVDWSGWYCAGCGHGREQVAHTFFQCTSCHELICGAKVRTLGPDIHTVECRPGCDGSGRLTGQISSYAGSWGKPALLQERSTDVALPGPRTGELPNL